MTDRWVKKVNLQIFSLVKPGRAKRTRSRRKMKKKEMWKKGKKEGKKGGREGGRERARDTERHCSGAVFGGESLCSFQKQRQMVVFCRSEGRLV